MIVLRLNLLRAFAAVAIACAGLAFPATAQNPNRGGAESGLPAEAREFDFWLGQWDLVLGGGQGLATNDISSFGLGGGIAILEDYRQGPYLGTSVSYYSPREGRWRQLWLDNMDGLLEFAGGTQGNKFVISGNLGTTKTRLVYSNITNRSLDQSADMSPDGLNWQVSFSARYTRRDGTSPADVTGYGSSGKRSVPMNGILPAASRQFDFWLGDWSVIGDDAFAGGDTITTYGLGGGICILQSLESNDGYQLSGVATYHPQDRIWNFVSIDSDGQHIDLTGGLRSGRMTLEGILTGAGEAPGTQARMTFDRPSDREITQTLEVSTDGGQTWNVRRTLNYARGSIAAPENLRVVKAKKKKVVLEWDDATTSETRFELLQRTGDEWTVIETLEPDSTTTTAKGLSRRTEYRFGIRGCDGFGCSEPAEVTVTTR